MPYWKYERTMCGQDLNFSTYILWPFSLGGDTEAGSVLPHFFKDCMRFLFCGSNESRSNFFPQMSAKLPLCSYFSPELPFCSCLCQFLSITFLFPVSRPLSLLSSPVITKHSFWPSLAMLLEESCVNSYLIPGISLLKESYLHLFDLKEEHLALQTPFKSLWFIIHISRSRMILMREVSIHCQNKDV